MTRFYFHVRSRSGILIDDEGIDISLEDALEYCLVCARDLICGDVSEGRIDLAQSILLSDAEGQLIHEIPFIAAVTFQHAADEAHAKHCPVLIDWSRLAASAATSVPVPMPAQPDVPDDGDAYVSRPYH